MIEATGIGPVHQANKGSEEHFACKHDKFAIPVDWSRA